MASVKTVDDLLVYRVALELLPKTNLLVEQLPWSHKRVKDQLIGSSHAIAPLIAEGFAKQKYPADAKRFFTLAMAECDETVTHLRIVWQMEIDKKLCNELGVKYTTQARRLNKMIQYWDIKKYK